jgi:hypothetical protein
VRSRSLLPGIVFHFLTNALEVMRQRASSVRLDVPEVVGWFASVTVNKQNEPVIRYHWPTLAVALVVAVFLIGRLLNVSRPASADAGPTEEPPAPESADEPSTAGAVRAP